MVPIVDVFTSFAGEAAEVLVGTCRFASWADKLFVCLQRRLPQETRCLCDRSRFAAANCLLSLRGNAWCDA